MKLVLATGVVVDAFRSPKGASAELLAMARRNEIDVVITVALVLKYKTALKRTDHLLAKGATFADAEKAIDMLLAIAEPTFVDNLWRPQTRDTSDEMVLEAAISGGADAIATYKRRDFGDAPQRFGIECWLPGRVLENMNRESAEPPRAGDELREGYGRR